MHDIIPTLLCSASVRFGWKGVPGQAELLLAQASSSKALVNDWTCSHSFAFLNGWATAVWEWKQAAHYKETRRMGRYLHMGSVCFKSYCIFRYPG
jgi:hypothetical protein